MVALGDGFYSTAENFAGNPGSFTYRVTDEDGNGISSEGRVDFLVTADNDQPNFGENGFVNIVYNGGVVEIELSVPAPSDVEDTLSQVTVSEILAAYGVALDGNGNVLAVGDVLSIDQLNQLKYQIDQSIQGPVGSLKLSCNRLRRLCQPPGPKPISQW